MILVRRWLVAVGLWLSLCTLVNAGPLDNWTVRRTNSAETLTEIAYANGTFVAVGYQGVILSSPDGKVWTRRNSGVTDDFHRVTFCRDRFFAFTWGGVLSSSADGMAWSAMDTYAAGLGSPRTMLWTNGLFIAGATLNGYSILTSTDGITWTTRFGTFQPYILDVTFGGGMYVAVGGANIIASSDGINWTNVAHPIYSGSFFRVAYGNNTFAVVGYFANSAPSVIMTSTNGLDWTTRDPNGDYELGTIAFGNGSFVAGGGRGIVATSEDAVNWTNRNSGVQDVWGVAYGRGTFVGVGPLGVIVQSDHFGPPQLTGRLLAASNALEISIESEIGSSLALQSSSNGVNWSDAATFTNTPSAITFIDSAITDSPHRLYRTISR